MIARSSTPEALKLALKLALELGFQSDRFKPQAHSNKEEYFASRQCRGTQ